ncbi:PaaI family thioesterase [bacterium]|nr:MAG: PaaI family thioesterase [bacterium]
MPASSTLKKPLDPLNIEEGSGLDKRWDALRDPSDPSQFVTGGWVAPAPFEKLCGMEIIEAGAGRSVLQMPFTVKLAMSEGLMHGGAITSLADTAVAVAIKTILPEKSLFVTSELTCKFLAPVEKGVITARAHISQYGGKHLVANAEITDENGCKVATLSATFRVLRHGKAE